MAAPTGYPSWVYNSTQLTSQIVQNVAAFNALPPPGIWTTTPFANPGTNPFDPNEQVTDTRLQQILIENRISNYLMANAFGGDDPQTVIRPDVLANDSSLTS